MLINSYLQDLQVGVVMCMYVWILTYHMVHAIHPLPPGILINTQIVTRYAGIFNNW